MNRIGGDGNRLPRPDEVMYAYPKLRSVIKNAGAQMLGHGIRTYRRKLVSGPDEAARTLNPGTNAVAAGEVPAQDRRQDADPGVGATCGKQIAARERTTWLRIAVGA